jgi:hypothetical protein
MSDDHPTGETMTIEEASISNMWEIAAIVEVLERSVVSKREL